MPLVYLDTCAIQRPLDDQTQFRVRVVEADAITTVLAAVEAGRIEIVSSAALRAEALRSPHPNRRIFTGQVLGLAMHSVALSNAVRSQALTYHAIGIKPFDALHLASAVLIKADFFCTTDDRLLRKAEAANRGTTRVVDPVGLAVALDL